MPTYTLERDGKTKTVDSPRELSQAELSMISAQTFGMPAAPKIEAPPKKPDDASVLGGALRETFGMGERPGAATLMGGPGVKTPLGVVAKPEGTL